MQLVLIVDDEPRILAQMKADLLSFDMGYEVQTSSNPVEAMLDIENRPVDLLISDYRMPVMDGIAMLQSVKKMDIDLSMLIMSANTDMAYIKSHTDLCAAVINKPWHLYDLQVLVTQALQLQRIKYENRQLVEEVAKQRERILDLCRFNNTEDLVEASLVEAAKNDYSISYPYK